MSMKKTDLARLADAKLGSAQAHPLQEGLA